MRTLLLSLFISALLPAALFAQTEEEWYLGKPISDVVFSGLDTVKESELEPIVRPYVGQEFSLEIFWEMQSKLYALDYFQSIEGNALPGDEARSSVTVEFGVTEKPSVDQIVLEGNRAVRRTEILDTILVKKGDLVSEAQARVDAAAIEDLYIRKGYLDAQVNGAIEPIEGENRVQVVFRVSEGVQTTIRSIRFAGNQFASESTLKREIKTKEQSLFTKGVFEEARLEEDILRIQDYYGEKGYVYARVLRVERQVEQNPEESRNYLNLVFYIEEGQQYNYGGMEFEGNVIFTDETLSGLVRLEPGTVLNERKLEAAYQRVTDLYYENGYIFNEIYREESVDPDTNTIRYTVRIAEKDRAHIENIILRGNEKTRDYVIYRELPFEVGDVFNKTEIIQGLRNLYNLQYFNAINPETPPGSAEGLMDLVINIEEGSTANINFGVMFSGGDYPISGMVRWQERNFLGRGQTIGVNLEFSNLRQLISFNFAEPWMLGTRWLGGAYFSLEHAIVPNVLQDIHEPYGVPDPYYSMDEFKEAQTIGEAVPKQYLMDYGTWKLSAGVNSGYRYFTNLGWLGVRGALSTGLEYLTYDSELYRPYDATVRDGLAVWSVANKLGTTLYWDNRDFFLNPTQGWYLGQELTFAGGFLFGDRHYIRADTTAEAFFTLLNRPVSDKWSLKLVLAAHSSLGFIFPQFGREEAVATVTDLLYLDGLNEARGWPLMKEKKAVWENSLELRLPIAEQFLWSALFFDAAIAWDEVSDMRLTRPEDFLFSIGAGVRFTIPQFPIRLYFAKRFQLENGRLQWRDGNLSLFGLGLDFVISLGGDVF